MEIRPKTESRSSRDFGDECLHEEVNYNRLYNRLCSQEQQWKEKQLEECPPNLLFCTEEELEGDECSGHTCLPEPIMPNFNVFNDYAINAKRWCKNTFDVLRKVEQPNINYYIVLTPYRKRTGMTLEQVVKHCKKNWRAIRLLITLETKKSDGTPINPHYNILITSKKY